MTFLTTAGRLLVAACATAMIAAPVFIGTFKALGANPDPMPLPKFTPHWKPEPWADRATRCLRCAT